jgi:hypothetical protein
MRTAVPGAALLVAAVLVAPSAKAQDVCGARSGGLCIVPFAEEPAVQPALPGEHGIVLDHWHDWLQESPWHYHPGPYDCPPPYCLPSYHRHRLRVVLANPLPVPVVLERLRSLEYDGFTTIVLDGSNYLIDARNRYGRPVRLLVSATTGLLRAQNVLPAFE